MFGRRGRSGFAPASNTQFYHRPSTNSAGRMMERHSDIGSEDNSSAARIGNTRLLVTHEGLLDKALLRRTEGYMHKKGGAVNGRGGFRNWKKRWFVIAEVEVLGAQGYELQYYDAPHGNLKGKVGLSEIDIQCEAKSLHKKVKYEFQIGLQNGGTLELSCDDANERDEWVETLNMITMYLKKILTTTAMTLDGYDPFDEDDEESFNIGEEIAQNCQAFGPGLFGAEAGVQSQFVVQVHDLMGQQVTRGGMPITATLSNAEAIYYLRVVDNDDGTYFCQYVLGRAGKYHLTVRLNDEHDIFGSPFAVEILPSKTIARFSVAQGEALNSIVANETQTFTITAMDGFGNRKNNGGDPFEVGVMGPAQLRALTDNADGSYTCTIAAHSPAAASYVTSSSLMVMVTLHGKAIAGSPFKPIITEDLRSLYAGGSSKGANNPRHPSGTSVASGAASVVSASSRGGASFSAQSQSLHSKHAMAQSAPPSVPYSPQGGELGLADLDGDDYGEDEEGNREEYSVSGASGGRQSPKMMGSGSVQGSVRSSVNQQAGGGRNHNVGSSSNSVASRAHTPPPAAVAGNNNARSSRTPSVAGSVAASAPNTAAAPAAAKPSASAAALSALAASGNSGTGAGGGLSRLERSRQRALLAKALSESGTNNTNAAPAPGDADMGTSPGPAAASDTQQGQGGRRLTKLEELQRSMASTGVSGGGRAPNAGNSNSAAGGAQRGEAFFSPPQPPQPQHRPGAPRPVSNEFLTQVVGNLQQGLGGGSVLSSTGNKGQPQQPGGVTPGYPANATQNEIKIWDHTQRAFGNEEVVKLLCSHLDVLRQVYETFADFVEGVQVIKLATSTNQQGGLYRLLELYDVTPTYLSKVEAKVLFTLTLHAQRNLRSPASVAGGGTGLDFPSFLKFLVMIAYHALSKTNAFSSLYSTIEAKVEVMLFKWALADSMKLQVVTSALRAAGGASII